ncbi:MAG TPA: hypothetical protein VHR84_09400 [Terriglobales bacterium]|jgi:glycogen debranching enzyme|nr:hypothetical protein [Terriglobales bacterium]
MRVSMRFVRRVITFLCILSGCSLLRAADKTNLELSRPVRSWEFLPIVGQRAGLFGTESGSFEAWVYPIKILRDLRLVFHVEGHDIPAESLARTVIVRPESATIIYASDTYTVRETLFVPVKEQGAVILLDVETETPLDIETRFIGDFALEWPAGLGGTFLNWDEGTHTFLFGEEQKKFAAIVGSPTATEPHVAYQDNYSSSDASSFRLGIISKGRQQKVIVLAASTEGLAAATDIYQHLSSAYEKLLEESAEYYAQYLDRTVSVELPDARIQRAYDWARVSTLQGLVTNPFLGTGLVAGYRTSGLSQRPGFAWFFGRDSFWTSFALNSIGDFATTRTALEFISKYQRDDGKMPHEISQGANFVPWFKDYPYGYASADATPLYIIAVNDYVSQSGDVAFAQQKWDSLWRAYQFLKSTYDQNGFPKNFGIGHGWVEGGPLLPVQSEFYQSGLAVEALRALSNLAALTSKQTGNLSSEYERQRGALNSAFWSPEKDFFAFALDNKGNRVPEASVLATVPMWFSLTNAPESQTMITQLAEPDHQTDWGMRIISSRSPHYGAGGYHFGSVWPLFTGWASVGEYRYHRPFPAYMNLRSNALLGSDGALGHVTEVLSGNYYQGLSTSSPHQIWSAAMVVSPILRGMLGLETQAQECRLTLAPHLPANWSTFNVKAARAGGASFDIRYRREPDQIAVEVKQTGGTHCTLDFSPAVSPRSVVTGVDVNDRKQDFKIEDNATDRHVNTHIPLLGGTTAVRVRLKNDFGLSMDSEMPTLGSPSQGLREISEVWDKAGNQLRVEFSGMSGRTYEVAVWNPGEVNVVDGATLSGKGAIGTLLVQFAQGSEGYTQQEVVFHFNRK